MIVLLRGACLSFIYFIAPVKELHKLETLNPWSLFDCQSIRSSGRKPARACCRIFKGLGLRGFRVAHKAHQVPLIGSLMPACACRLRLALLQFFSVLSPKPKPLSRCFCGHSFQAWIPCGSAARPAGHLLTHGISNTQVGGQS